MPISDTRSLETFFFAKPPMLRVGISVDSVINFEEVSDYPIPLGKEFQIFGP